MGVPCTLGIWRVRRGRTEEFVAAWTEFAAWTVEHVEGAGTGTILRDLEDDHRFVTSGPWSSLDAIDARRVLDGWKARVEAIRDLLEGFEPVTLEMVKEVGPVGR